MSECILVPNAVGNTYVYDRADQIISMSTNRVISTGSRFDHHPLRSNLGTVWRRYNTYRWNLSDQLVSVRKKGESTPFGEYKYDDDGRRIQKIVNGTITNYIYAVTA
ncbi:hypothetical protein [Siminovitchia fortis]|nr:hypothetical protein [Siminovitchia fortis]